jgi:hypothetical protein
MIQKKLKDTSDINAKLKELTYAFGFISNKLDVLSSRSEVYKECHDTRF